MLGWQNPCTKITNLAPTRPLEGIVPAQRVHVLHPTAYHGDVSTYELYALNSLVKAFAPTTIFEIGTLHGRTTVNLLENAEQLDTLYTLDILEELPANKFAEHADAKKVKRIISDSLSFNIEPYRGRIDFIFIDADHTYDAVVSDSEKALEMLSTTGVVVWHDYTFVSDTKEACNDFIGRHPERRFIHIKDTTMLLMLASA